MSIEDALCKSAAAQEKLAAAMDRYAGVMEQIAASGVTFVGTPAQLPEGASTSSTSAPAPDEKEDKPKRRGRKTNAEKEAEKKAAEQTDDNGGDDGDDPFGDDNGDDPFGDDDSAEKTYTAAEIRELLLKVRDKGGEKQNAAAAKEIIKKIGVSSIAEIPEDKFAKVADLCNKALAK